MFTETTSSSGYSLAPHPQSLVEDVQITFDTDMMDEDEALAYQQQPQQNAGELGLMTSGVTIGFDTSGDMDTRMDTDTVQVAAEKVHLRGVDTMATGDIEAWARKWVGEEGGLVKVQWIDDSSCKQVTAVSTQWREGQFWCEGGGGGVGRRESAGVYVLRGLRSWGTISRPNNC